MKILNKLTLKNLRMNKSRTIVTIIAILLSTALITTVAGMALSAQQTMIEAEIRSAGDYEIQLSGGNSERVKEIKANRNVDNVYASDFIGFSYLDGAKNKKRPYIEVKAYSENALEDCFKIKLSEGSFPKNDSELLLTQSLIKNTDKKFSIGDTITLELGKRYSDQTNTEIPEQFPYGMIDEEYTYEGDEKSEFTETLKLEQTKTYKIVGIIADDGFSRALNDNNMSGCYAFTGLDNKNLTGNACLYVDIKPEYEKDYIKVASQITGLSEKLAEKYILNNCSEEELEIVNKSLSSLKYTDFDINADQLKYKGYYRVADETINTLYWLAAIIIAIVIFTGVFVIRNSFAISITEKTKLYGMMASVGATRKQIRRNVLFEGFCLGIIGIPLGLLLGVGVIWGLITILNCLLAESLNGIEFVYIIPVVPMIFAVILSAFVILMSSITSAVRASKISPVDAIRGNKDVKLSKKPKKYKAPKLIKKLFGVGGDIAYKNLKRSKKKYRTTVISIVVSITMFISISAFMDYGLKYTNEFYSEQLCNIAVNCNSNENDDPDSILADFKKIENLDGINSSFFTITTPWHAYVDKSDVNIDKDNLDYYNYFFDNLQDYGDEVDENKVGFGNILLKEYDDNQFRKIVKELGLNYDDVKDKAIFYNTYSYNDDGVKIYDRILNFNDGEKIDIYSEYKSNEKLPIEIAMVVNNKTNVLDNNGVRSCDLIVREGLVKAYDNYPSYALYIDAEDADKLEQKIYELNIDYISVYNIDKTARQFNSLILVFEIFIYGFIAVITLIGITNIFNTITTNMRLRQKEFAMLKSVGMTRKEFNRMIRLESLFYGTKSLIIGIPLGILGAFGIFFAFSQSVVYDYVFPWKAILISIAFVFIVVWMIMKFSISKVRKQNIIETIRNDNI